MRAPSQSRIRFAAAFTLVELMVAVAIMMVIIYALYQMFNQTQRAMRSNIRQVDVMEAGRAAMEMISSELEQISPSQLLGSTNFFVQNAYGRSFPMPPLVFYDSDGVTPVLTNALDDVCFLNFTTNHWVANGYLVRATNGVGVGTLYRFTVATNWHALTARNLSAVAAAWFSLPSGSALATNLARVADGIVDFRVRAFDAYGRPLDCAFINGRPADFYVTNLPPQYAIARLDSSGNRLQPAALYSSPAVLTNPLAANVILQQDFNAETRMTFLSNAVPAYVELEMAVLDPQVFKQYQALQAAPAAVARDFLRRQGAAVHIFKRQIAIRTVMP